MDGPLFEHRKGNSLVEALASAASTKTFVLSAVEHPTPTAAAGTALHSTALPHIKQSYR